MTDPTDKDRAEGNIADNFDHEKGMDTDKKTVDRIVRAFTMYLNDGDLSEFIDDVETILKDNERHHQISITQ